MSAATVLWSTSRTVVSEIMASAWPAAQCAQDLCRARPGLVCPAFARHRVLQCSGLPRASRRRKGRRQKSKNTNAGR
jgi:hypothetical protein